MIITLFYFSTNNYVYKLVKNKIDVNSFFYIYEEKYSLQAIQAKCNIFNYMYFKIIMKVIFVIQITTRDIILSPYIHMSQ